MQAWPAGLSHRIFGQLNARAVEINWSGSFDGNGLAKLFRPA